MCKVRFSVRAAVATVGLASLAGACGDSGDGSGGLAPSPGPPEDLGVPVTSPGEVGSRTGLVWASNDEIIFIGPAYRDLKSVRVSDGSIRLLNTSSNRIIEAPFVSPDGQWIYRERMDGVGNDYALERVPRDGGIAELLARNVTGFLLTAWALPPLSSHAEVIAYAARGEKQQHGTVYINSTKDTLYLLDLTTGSLRNLGSGVPLTFSPSGAELLYDEKPCNETGLYTNPCDTYRVNLTTMARTHVPWDKGDIAKIPWWDASGIRAFVSCDIYVPGTTNSWCIRNLSQGTVTVVHALVLGEEVPWGSPRCVSPDRRWAAGWDLHFKAGFLALHVADLIVGGTRILVVSRTANAYGCAFSPDGRQVAYLVGQHNSSGNTVQIFVHDL